MSSWKWAAVFTAIISAFCFGFFCGIDGWQVDVNHPVVYRPYEWTYIELRDSIATLNRMIPDEPDTVYRDEDKILVFHPGGYVDVLKKFSPKKTYENFIVPGKFNGKVPPLNFSTCDWGKKYITVTRESVDDTAEFAGYYAFARWGCGSPCQMCSIIDLRTGNVYSGPDATGGYEYRADSRILIVNPPDSNGYYYANSIWPPPEQYLWTGNSFKLLE